MSNDPIGSLEIRDEDVKRFREKYQRKNENDCWPWIAAFDSKGYGCTRINGKVRRANRIAWMIANGPIPDGLHILHKCDNKYCVNPEHLYAGTNQQNQIDVVIRRRRKLKLTPEDVKDIRDLLSAGLSQKEISHLYGLVQQTVSEIHRRLIWKHI